MEAKGLTEVQKFEIVNEARLKIGDTVDLLLEIGRLEGHAEGFKSGIDTGAKIARETLEGFK